MVVILRQMVTGSAEIVVTAGSSSDDQVVIADFLGMTVGDVIRKLERQGYALAFVTEHYLVLQKHARRERRARQAKPTLFPMS
ncbi:hypothetical protein C7445_104142 [Alicyclobacillus sacchari]|uniref:Uncharacterized protein n=1 Tax=Alicyclobacillus sacchari TaxID=392010 RepID=A0A4R8LQ21_9BACL|nr:hypothetical protein [Alicyclobacillus sacchari]TDY49629.1 hypothetical protein C7445_104142 [Alicyclobacillus sacchari]GMA58481.1 hypothetical protein GCM10025858_29840 [Alicyclobacillus sacchari]